MADQPTDEDVALAQDLLRRWDDGRGEAKSRLEIETWGDATAHGRHFDRFVRTVLGVHTSRPSKQSDRIADLERQVRGMGGAPVGAEVAHWEDQLRHARESCLAALRVWNDPTARFRTGAFSLLFVTAWNSVAIALIQRSGGEWRKLSNDGTVREVGGVEQSLDSWDLVLAAFPGREREALRENIRYWLDLRNCVAHRHLPDLDLPVIPQAQAGLVNIENVFVEEFGAEYALSDALTVPLQLSGFRDPGVLASRKKLQSSLPLDVQAVLARADELDPDIAADPAFQMRVAFVPVVPGSGRNPDAISYFVKPGEVPTEVAQVLDHYVVLPKVSLGSRPNLAATEVVSEVTRRTGYRFSTTDHAAAARKLGARPATGKPDRTMELRFAEYITSFKRYLYTQAWIDRLVAELGSEDGYKAVLGRPPVQLSQP